jgi:hypothetical protein
MKAFKQKLLQFSACSTFSFAHTAAETIEGIGLRSARSYGAMAIQLESNSGGVRPIRAKTDAFSVDGMGTYLLKSVSNGVSATSWR